MKREIQRLYGRSKLSVVALTLIIIFAVIALVGPYTYSVNPFSTGPDSFFPPWSRYPMGTDDLGRDVFAQLLSGIRTSMIIGSLASIATVLIGMMIGAVSGYVGGWVDDILMRLTEFFQVIPRFVLALVMVSLLGSSIWNVILVIGLLSWPTTARLMRAQYLSLRQQEFVEAAKVIGIGHLKIIFLEILPNAMAPVVINSTLEVANAVLLESGLSFLGLGDPSAVSLGVMLNRAMLFMRTAWWLTVFPGAAISVLVLSFNLVGDTLSEELNPRKPIEL